MPLSIKDLTAPERQALSLLHASERLAIGRRTDAAGRTIHARVAESLSRKNLVRLRPKSRPASSASLTPTGKRLATEIAAEPPEPRAATQSDAIVRALPMDLVYPDPNQPRTVFKEAELHELGASIRERGLLHAIKVRPDGQGRFMIILGERRWRAHKLLGAETILASVAPMGEDDAADAALVENLQRRDITPLEEARAYQRRLDTGLTVDELAKRLGLKQPWRITERTNLLRLGKEYQDALACGVLTPSQAQEMSRLVAPSQRTLFEAIRTGRCATYAELRRVTQALYDAEHQGKLWDTAPPSDQERRAAAGLEQKIERICAVVAAGFDGNDVVILRRVNPLKADVLADKLGVLETAIKRLRLALRAAAVTATKEGIAA